MAKMDKATIIGLIIIILSFTGIIFGISQIFSSSCSSGFVYDNDQKKCRVKCKENEIYYPSIDKCLDCPPGQSLFGATCRKSCELGQGQCGDNCYNIAQENCIDGMICDISRTCLDKDGNIICCGSGTRCDKFGSGLCVACDTSDVLCGGICCNSGEVCAGGECCNPEYTCGNKKCCKNKKCCGDGDDGTCCNDNEVCEGGKCLPKCGNTICTDNQICQIVKSPNGDVSTCITNDGCKWSPLIYDPAMVGPNADIPTYKNKLDQITICSDPTGILGPFTRTVTTSRDPAKQVCTIGDCYKRVSEEDMEFNSWDPVNQVCKGEFNHPPHKCDTCPPGLGTSCCNNEGKFSGQVCPQGQGNCYDQNGIKICGKGWIPNKDYSHTFDWYDKCVVSNTMETTFGLESECENAMMNMNNNNICKGDPDSSKKIPGAITCKYFKWGMYSPGQNPGNCVRNDTQWINGPIKDGYKAEQDVIVKLSADYDVTNWGGNHKGRNEGGIRGNGWDEKDKICAKDNYYYHVPPGRKGNHYNIHGCWKTKSDISGISDIINPEYVVFDKCLDILTKEEEEEENR